MPRPSDWIGVFLYAGVLLDYLVLNHRSLWQVQTPLVAGALAVIVASERWEYWRYGEHAPRWLRLVLFVLHALLIELVAQITFAGIGAFLYLILPLKAWLGFGRAPGFAAAIAVMVLYSMKTMGEVDQLTIPFEHLISGGILFGTAVAFVLTISHLATRDRLDRERAEQLLDLLAHSHRALERSHEELAAYAAQVADLAALAERSRVARDIHDGLGHYLTAITIQLEKALAFYEKDSHEAQRSIQMSRRLAQEALADVRHSVGLLRSRQRSFSLAAMLEGLAGAEIGGQPQIAVTLQGNEHDYSLELRMVLFRVAQEGLTNVRRHARANNALLEVCFDEQRATLRVLDDGVGFDLARYETAAKRGAVGYGIEGLRERVALVGGSLAIAPADGGGTMLTVALPRTLAHET